MKTYLGDAVYAELEDGMIKLTTEYGEGPTNTVYLEPEIYEALQRWLEAASRES